MKWLPTIFWAIFDKLAIVARLRRMRINRAVWPDWAITATFYMHTLGNNFELIAEFVKGPAP